VYQGLRDEYGRYKYPVESIREVVEMYNQALITGMATTKPVYAFKLGFLHFKTMPFNRKFKHKDERRRPGLPFRVTPKIRLSSSGVAELKKAIMLFNYWDDDEDKLVRKENIGK